MSLDTDIGNLIASSQALVDMFEGKEEKIETALQNALKTAPTLSRRFYLDSVNGNDENDGTESSPIRTIKEVSNRASFGFQLVIYLKKGQTYLVEDHVYFNSCYVRVFSYGDEIENPKIKPEPFLYEGKMRAYNINLPNSCYYSTGVDYETLNIEDGEIKDTYHSPIFSASNYDVFCSINIWKCSLKLNDGPVLISRPGREIFSLSLFSVDIIGDGKVVDKADSGGVYMLSSQSVSIPVDKTVDEYFSVKTNGIDTRAINCISNISELFGA